MHPENPPRPWRMVAAEVAAEFDPKKLAVLVEELNQALEEQGIGRSDGQSKKLD
jgi:hypothetical protein